MEDREDLSMFVDVGGEPLRDGEKGRGEWLKARWWHIEEEETLEERGRATAGAELRRGSPGMGCRRSKVGA